MEAMNKGLLSDVIDLLPAVSEDSEGMLSGGFLGVSAFSEASGKSNVDCKNRWCKNSACINDNCTNSWCKNKNCKNGG